MKKIEINLYPYTSDKDKGFLKLIEKYFPIALLAFFVLIAINIILFLIIIFSYLPYNNLSKNWKKLSPQATTISSLKEELKSLKDKKEKYQELLSSKIEVSHIFADIFTSLPKNIWLEEINFSNGFMGFVGYVVEWKEDYSVSINKFIKNLKEKDYFFNTFKYINPKRNVKMKLAGREIMKFEVECKSSK